MVIVTVYLQKERGMIIGNHPLEVNHCVEIVHISVDGTDFQIAEHREKFYSHKFKKSGLRYEVSSEKSK